MAFMCSLCCLSMLKPINYKLPQSLFMDSDITKALLNTVQFQYTIISKEQIHSGYTENFTVSQQYPNNNYPRKKKDFKRNKMQVTKHLQML